jgi:nitrate reductase gamma subunit
VKGTFRRNAVTYLAGGVFHLGLLAVIFFSRTHMLVWKGILGIGWPTLPPYSVGWLTAGAIVAMVALLIHRLVNPVLKLLSGPAEWFNWLFVFLPMATGFIMARQLWLPYEVAFSVHMLSVDALLVWIPLSRLSHFLFYFFSRTIHGVEFGGRSATP